MAYDHAKEVIDGLILGGLRDIYEILCFGPDVLVPLHSLNGDIWNRGFRGEILYYPIMDFNILPDDVLDRLVEDVLARLKGGKRVAIFCSGGHGRTGYVAACVLARLGIEDPVGFLRKNYNEKAVETVPQMQAIGRFVERNK